MNATTLDLQVRPMEDTDLDDIVTIDERITGTYRPDHWENQITYYLRRDPDASLVAEADGKVVGFMLGELRSGEFGLDDAAGWIEILGVDPDYRKRAIGRRLGERMLTYFGSKGATSVRTLVEEDMADISGFFSSLGFAPDSARPFVKKL